MKFRGWKGEKDLGKFKGKNMIKMCCMKILKKKTKWFTESHSPH